MLCGGQVDRDFQKRYDTCSNSVKGIHMGLSAAEKILSQHLVEGKLQAGNEIGIKIDQTLTQDATGTMVYLQFESLGISRVKTELSVSYVDHNTLQSDFRNMDDHLYLQSIAKKYGIFFSKPGNGICHQVHLERFGIPGKTLLGSDSHTPTCGGLGMVAIGAGGLDVAGALAGAPFYLTCPEIIGVHLSGNLKPMCSAKDIILTILGMETVKGGIGKIYEYFGSGVAGLSVPERSTITNMGAELGATTSIFPSDSVTRDFFALQKRQGWQELMKDDDASFARIIEIDLDRIEPMCAQPHMPDNVVPVRKLEGKKVDQVSIGSCTNSSINDLGIAADILGGNPVAEHLSLSVSPGSLQVLKSTMAAGILQIFVQSGTRILENACGPCIGMGFAPSSRGVALRTFNRNFKGRSGTPDAEVYLVSPETAAASALAGVITDPRRTSIKQVKNYNRFVLPDATMIIPPASEEESAHVTIVRGPNIQPCPRGRTLEETLETRVLLKTEDNITTDHIMPAGARILPLRSNIPEIAKHVFESVDPSFYGRAMEAGTGVIIGGENYGQGSSREHAALAPMYLGIRVVIAKSFARIHKANLINVGILPLVFKDPGDYDQIHQDDPVAFPGLKHELIAGSTITMEQKKTRKVFTLIHDLEQRSVDLVLAGGRLQFIRMRTE